MMHSRCILRTHDKLDSIDSKQLKKEKTFLRARAPSMRPSPPARPFPHEPIVETQTLPPLNGSASKVACQCRSGSPTKYADGDSFGALGTRRPPRVYTREEGADNRWLMTDIPQDPSKAILASKTFTIPSPEPPWLGEVDPVAQSFLLPFRK